MLLQYGVFGIFMLMGVLRVHLVRALMVLAFVSFAMIVHAVYNADAGYSPGSLFLLTLILTMYAFVVPMDEENYNRILRTFQLIAVVASVLVFFNWGTQVAGLGMFNLEDFIPDKFQYINYVYMNKLVWNQPWYKPNGIVFLEVSHLSQFIGMALVIELARFRRLKYAALYAVALLSLLRRHRHAAGHRLGAFPACHAAAKIHRGRRACRAAPAGRRRADRRARQLHQASDRIRHGKEQRLQSLRAACRDLGERAGARRARRPAGQRRRQHPGRRPDQGRRQRLRVEPLRQGDLRIRADRLPLVAAADALRHLQPGHTVHHLLDRFPAVQFPERRAERAAAHRLLLHPGSRLCHDADGEVAVSRGAGEAESPAPHGRRQTGASATNVSPATPPSAGRPLSP